MGTLFRRSRAGKQSNWIAEYTNHSGERIQKSTKTADKKTASQILLHWENEAVKRSSGMIDPRLERYAKQSNRPISEHAAEFCASLTSAARSTVHTDRTKKRLDTIIELCDWTSLADITPESVEKFAGDLRKENRSNQTVAHYLQVAKQFTRWLLRTDRVQINLLDTIRKPNPSKDRRRRRRMLLPAEWPWLAKAAGERAVIYETAIQTGLRSGELRSLKPSSVKHTSSPPYVIIASGDTKDGNTARQYITAALAAKLSKLKPVSNDQLFELPTGFDMADLLRADLAAARLLWERRRGKKKSDAQSDFLLPTNHAKESLDFHSLRHTCGAWLAMQGVHPKPIQNIMRHKSITLTMDTYGHLFPNAEPEAIGKMEAFLNASEFASSSSDHPRPLPKSHHPSKTPQNAAF